jgi:hypothetical protein
MGFLTLHSIEVCEANFLAARAKFSGLPNVHLHYGSSPDVLPAIIDPKLPTTFWLDAHYQGGDRREQDKKYGECPLLAELRVIFSYDWSPIVLIDDAHMFDHLIPPGFNRDHWPTVAQIRDALPASYRLQEHNGILYCTPGK